MHMEDVSPALQERLGLEATVGLLALLDTARHEWRAEVTEHTVDRFERRLTTEISQARIELKKEIGDLRVEVKQDINDLRVELKQDINGVRVELKQDINDLRGEVRQEINDLRLTITGGLSELKASLNKSLLNQTRWMFGMWVGQVVAIAAIIAAMFQISGR